jgi:hypothetical protein
MGLPVIFDLPAPVAVKRADEFTRSVHPVLQRACVHCHHENYQGNFQLIEVKTRKDLTPNVARANLEAALRLIDPDNLPRSELLSRALVPHGRQKAPSFQGATDPGYRALEAWVKSLRARPAQGTETTRFGAAEPVTSVSDSESFAVQRVRATPTASAPPPSALADGRPRPPEAPNPVTPLPPGQFVPGSGSGMPAAAPPDAEFPVPYMLGGPRPKPEAAPAPTPAPAAQATPPLPAAAAAPAPGATDTSASKSAKKPVKLDPSLLERALMNRYAPH